MKFEEAFLKIREDPCIVMTLEDWTWFDNCIGYAIQNGSLKTVIFENNVHGRGTYSVLSINNCSLCCFPFTSIEMLSERWIVRNM